MLFVGGISKNRYVVDIKGSTYVGSSLSREPGRPPCPRFAPRNPERTRNCPAWWWKGSPEMFLSMTEGVYLANGNGLDEKLIQKWLGTAKVA